jgi:hypothetical protein
LQNEIGTSRQRRLHKRHDVVVDDGIRVRKDQGNDGGKNGGGALVEVAGARRRFSPTQPTAGSGRSRSHGANTSKIFFAAVKLT